MSHLLNNVGSIILLSILSVAICFLTIPINWPRRCSLSDLPSVSSLLHYRELSDLMFPTRISFPLSRCYDGDIWPSLVFT